MQEKGVVSPMENQFLVSRLGLVSKALFGLTTCEARYAIHFTTHHPV